MKATGLLAAHTWPRVTKYLTSVNAGELSPEVDERRQLVDAVLLGVARVVDLDEGDVECVRLLVDALQPAQDALARGTTALDCIMRETKDSISIIA